VSADTMSAAQHARAAELYRDAAYALWALSEESLNLSQSTRESLDDTRAELQWMRYCLAQQPRKGGRP